LARLQDVADSRHLNNRVEREVVDALVASVRAAYPKLSHRYYGLKANGSRRSARLLDRNAPLPFCCDRHHRLPEARTWCCRPIAASRPIWPTSPSVSSPTAGSMRGASGQAPGAFSHPTTPFGAPHVLMNYQGKPRDVMTLAHELGHGVHQVLAAKTAR